MSLRDQLNAVKTIAGATSKIGRQFGHLLYANNDADLQTFFKDANGRIDVGLWTRESTQAVEHGVNSEWDRHTLVLAWYRSVTRAADDSQNSEDAFQDDVESVRAVFLANRKLTVASVHYSPLLADPMVARMVGYVSFCNVLCHYAELVIVPWDGPNATQSL